MSQHQAFYEYICALQPELRQAFQRRMVVLTGTQASCFAVMNHLCGMLQQHETLLVSDQDPAKTVETSKHFATLSSIPAHKLKQWLGQEVDTLIWDGFSGLNPDALGIASGLVRGGGIFFLLLPDFAQLFQQADQDYRRMCADDNLLQQCHTFFLKRLVRHIQADTSVLVYSTDQPEMFQPVALNLPAACAPQLPTADQEKALKAIIRTAKGHRYRPLVLLADRGRGKSSVLGMAAAQLAIQHHYKIAISAPDKATCRSAFVRYRDLVTSTLSNPETIQAALEAFQFLPLDQLKENSSDFHLIMIDEAAAMPTPLLQTLLASHPRLVFATTLHGYEGHGQGFAIRFRHALDQITPQWKVLGLNSAVRWQDHDPLEQWFFRFLLLNASTKPLSLNITPANERKADPHRPKPEVIWLKQADLYHDEVLFESVFSLLVSAHYQTKPSDIRLILDHPHVKLAIAVAPYTDDHQHDADDKKLLGVMLILEEGGLTPDLAIDIIAGTRRPRGHLFPQALCASSGKPECLSQRSYRITRIAVGVEARQQGIGSALLEAACELARSNNIDSLSSSFGLRPELLAFWSKNHFDMVKLGLHTDGASGNQSIMLMRPLSEAAIRLSSELRRDFRCYFLFNLNRVYQPLDSGNCLAILRSMIDRTELVDFTQTPVTPTLKAFAEAQRSFEDSNHEVYNFVLASLTSPNWQELDQRTEQLLVMRVLQGHSNEHCARNLKWHGKKDIERALRQALRILISG